MLRYQEDKTRKNEEINEIESSKLARFRTGYRLETDLHYENLAASTVN